MTTPKAGSGRALKGLIFDMGDILYDATAWRRWLADELRARRYDVSYETLVSKWEGLLEDVYCGKAEYWERFDQLLRKFSVSEVSIPEITTAARQKSLTVQEDRKPFEGVRTTLDVLRSQGRSLAVLTDTESSRLSVGRTLEQLGLGSHFDAVVTSKDIGFAKPAPEAFAAALAALGLNADECAFVGHDEDELVGARSAGLLAIAFNADESVTRDIWIDSFSELLSL